MGFALTHGLSKQGLFFVNIPEIFVYAVFSKCFLFHKSFPFGRNSGVEGEIP